MKRETNVLSAILVYCIPAFLLAGCKGTEQSDTDIFQSVKKEETIRLQDTADSPSCKFSIDYSYLAENDSTGVARRINSTIQGIVLGEEYARLAPSVALENYENAYISDYRDDVRELYEEDVRQGVAAEDLPAWYNYEYSLSSTFAYGKKDVLTYTATTYHYSGGAHPNQWSTWLNFDLNTGKRLTLDQVFIAGSEQAICQLLADELMREMTRKHPEENLHTLEDLRAQGILLDSQIYVPENFLLQPDRVAFLYNKYDIAPYSEGTICLSLPYAKLEKYMIR